MKLFLVCLAALIALAVGQDLPAAGNVRKSRRVQYSGGYKDGIKVTTDAITFFLSYKPNSDVYTSLTDQFALTSVGGTAPLAPLNNATFIFTFLGQATSYTPVVSTTQPVNSNILGVPTFREVQIVAAPGYSQRVLIEFAVQGCFDQLTLTFGGTNVVGALCYQGFVTGNNGLLVITGGSGDFTGATGTIYQNLQTETVMNVQVPSLVTLYFVLNLA
eukprot:CAMPEP_0113450938 /NCGR_PEP_ID=MMETSP0014_2-20120614/6085_1 /TAXON_ID=2857 /ORGANISM="Nitzschia sp." /LENGTH=216 /DNA_ID=CAMNT_0000342287 /DNA_START=1152 /DNA_END=1802 /DNA_ORIENTATION=+ /assembly_acc=CAM_ASM_000159